MENYPVPLVLKCTLTGQEVKYYSRPYIEKRIARAGDLATLINTFMAKGAKKKTTVHKIPATKTWKGEDIIKSVNKQEEQNVVVAGENNNKGEKVYKYADGGQCRVTYS
jgi:hypothetical protein